MVMRTKYQILKEEGLTDRQIKKALMSMKSGVAYIGSFRNSINTHYDNDTIGEIILWHQKQKHTM